MKAGKLPDSSPHHGHGNRLFDQRSQAPPVQSFVNGEIHDWYRITLGYSDKVVGQLIDEFELRQGHRVLDPFCGSGTTLVECMKRGIRSYGIDANPSSCFAARVKTHWKLCPSELLEGLAAIEATYKEIVRRRSPFRTDPTYLYLQEAGFITRGWISPEPLRKVIRLKHSINLTPLSQDIKEALRLALTAELVRGASNVKFGPELYCGKPKQDANVLEGLRGRVKQMASDLRIADLANSAPAMVFEADARDLSDMENVIGCIDAVICSPPYPTEHDYTRNARLELALMEAVTDRQSLRKIKRQMMRSHTKGIYSGDDDGAYVSGVLEIEDICDKIDSAVVGKTSGFHKLYPKVVREYFGGMKRHLDSVLPIIKPGGFAAYVVGDQFSYCRVPVPTAEILEILARRAGFESLGIKHLRLRWSSATASNVAENILVLKRPTTNA